MSNSLKRKSRKSGVQTNSASGMSGLFRCIRMDSRFLKGSGPNKSVEFEDLFKRVDGDWVPKDKSRVIEDISFKNKWLKRGLSLILHRTIADHGGGPYVPVDITAGQTTDCFEAMMFIADKWNSQPPSGSPDYEGDARVDWSESDGASNVAIPPADSPTSPRSPAGQGRRGIDLDTTSGILKRVSAAYVSTSPYREIEYVVYAQPNDGSTVQSTGTITTIAGNLISDGEWFELSDGINSNRRFEFDKSSPGSFTLGNYRIAISDSDSADDVRDAIITAINDQDDDELLMDASSGGSATVALTHRTGGYIGNVAAPTDGVSNASFVVSTMSGGSGVERDDDEIDNLAIKAIGLSAGVNSGAGEADSYWGIRSIIGLSPTFQGDADRGYIHEGKSLHKYVAAETVTAIGLDGYVESDFNTQTAIDSITTNAGDSISSGLITMVNAVDDCVSGQGFLAKDHFRKALLITGGTNDGKRFTIRKVVSPTSIQVWESITDDSNGFTAQIVEDYIGMNAFDGRVENEGLVDSSTDDHDQKGTVQHGEQWIASTVGSSPEYAWVGRVWSTAKKVRGIRICIPQGCPKDAVPNYFLIQYLDSVKGDEPADYTIATGDWTTFTSGDFSSSAQGEDIFEAGAYGVEYTFPDTLPTTKGVRLVGIRAIDETVPPRIGALMIFTDWDVSGSGVEITSGVDDRLDLATDGIPTFKQFNIGNVGPSQDMQDFVDAINAHISGWQLEAVRSRFGFLWIRGTVAGNNSLVDIDNPSGSLNTKLGLPSSSIQKTGITQIIRKFPPNALTIIYRCAISGDLPRAS